MCEEEEGEEGRRMGEEKGRGRELEEWLELYLSPGGCRLSEVDSENRVLMLAEAMANIDQGWFGGLRWEMVIRYLCFRRLFSFIISGVKRM